MGEPATNTTTGAMWLRSCAPSREEHATHGAASGSAVCGRLLPGPATQLVLLSAGYLQLWEFQVCSIAGLHMLSVLHLTDIMRLFGNIKQVTLGLIQVLFSNSF